MRGRWEWILLAGMLTSGMVVPAWGNDGTASFSPQGRQLYVVGTAHLDTQWRWTIKETIDEFIPATLHENFALFDKYPGYVFSFEGAFRYMLIKEYYPREYEELQRRIAQGRWRVAGSWVDAVDVNIPSPESLIRQTLYGNGFFRKEFGKASRDVFLPDCFGFGYALPSAAAHCGLLGFSTQKLAWGSSVGIPFNIGIWRGVDRSSLVAALNPGEYVARIGGDLRSDSAVVATVEEQGKSSGLYAAYKYFGTGDTGGSPTEESVAWLERALAGGGPVRVRSTASDQLARDLTEGLSDQQRARLPHYTGELLMTDHGTGCYTSQTAMKRWNRRNEKLADAAERISVLADQWGVRPYPRNTFNQAWIRFLWHQFHDDLTGTSIPEAYAYSWNDEAISQNQFAQVLTDAVSGLCNGMDTDVSGIPLVVYNPLSIPRQDLVQAEVRFPGTAPAAVRVFGPNGEEVPSQSRRVDGRTLEVSFLAGVPSVGLCLYEVRASDQACPQETGLRVTPRLLENERYRVEVTADGEIGSIWDKRFGRALLSRPLELQFLKDAPKKWMAWEFSYEGVMAEPAARLGGPAEIRIRDQGPACVALEVRRTGLGSGFRQIYRLASGGAADRLEITNEIDWRSPGMLLKAAFPLSVRADSATYDLGIGSIRRAGNHPKLYEVPAQLWADLSEPEGSIRPPGSNRPAGSDQPADGSPRYGVAILNDSRYGWDKPDDHTLRLSLVRTPEVHPRWNWIRDQRSMDLGQHTVTYALYGHAGLGKNQAMPGGESAIFWQAERLNQPLRVFQTERKKGNLGRYLSLLAVNDPNVAVKACKLAEDTDEIVLRLQELSGTSRPQVEVDCFAPIRGLREVNGAEEPLDAGVQRGPCLRTSFGPYQTRTFALQLAGGTSASEASPASPAACLPLPYNLRGFTRSDQVNEADLDGRGHSLPEELMPGVLSSCGIPFRFGPKDAPNLLLCRGQKIRLSQPGPGALYLIAASFAGDRKAAFTVQGREQEIWIQDYTEPIAQWDSRLMSGGLVEDPASIIPAYLKEDPVAWVGTHLHTISGGRETYTYGIFYRYRLELPDGAREIILPRDDRIGLAAATQVREEETATFPACALYDRPGRTAVAIEAPDSDFLDSLRVRVHSPNRGAVIRYTMDGSRPSEASPLYLGPFAVRTSATVKARAFLPGMDDRFVASLPVRRLELRRGESYDNLLPGLSCRYYEGTWDKLPEFQSLTPRQRAVQAEVALPSFVRREDFGLVFEGRIRVEKDGLYTFHLWSDDGSALWIGDERCIVNDGLHGKGEVKGRVALQAGIHPIRVEYFQGKGGAALELWWEGPGVGLEMVPGGVLFH